MRKQRDRCAKAGPVGSGLLRFGERRKREGKKRAAAAGRQNFTAERQNFTESLLFSNHCAIIPVTMVINER